MPPWLDWLDWLKWDSLGAGVIGKVLGLWFRACATVVKGIWQLFLSRGPRDRSLAPVPTFKSFTKHDPGEHLLVKKTINITISTALTLLIWKMLTWKPVWNSAGPRGDRILAAILVLVSALWIVSLISICFWKPGRSRVFRLAPFKSSYIKSRTERPRQLL